MKKLTDTLSVIKNIFCRQQSSAIDASAGCVEITCAALRTEGGGGGAMEGSRRKMRPQW
jgi:hypothetical protein